MMNKVHVNIARPDAVLIARVVCECTEDRKLKIHPRCLIEHYPWYGFNFTCLRCGEIFYELERAPRPLMRGWRQRNINRAHQRMQMYFNDLREGRCIKGDLWEVQYPDSRADFLEERRGEREKGEGPANAEPPENPSRPA